MPTYIALHNFTDQGIRTITETIQRADGAAELAKQYGASLQTYWTAGPYDVVYILEAPTMRVQPPSSWMSAQEESSGRLRSAPTIAKRCRASSRRLDLHPVHER